MDSRLELRIHDFLWANEAKPRSVWQQQFWRSPDGRYGPCIPKIVRAIDGRNAVGNASSITRKGGGEYQSRLVCQLYRLPIGQRLQPDLARAEERRAIAYEREEVAIRRERGSRR